VYGIAEVVLEVTKIVPFIKEVNEDPEMIGSWVIELSMESLVFGMAWIRDDFMLNSLRVARN